VAIHCEAKQLAVGPELVGAGAHQRRGIRVDGERRLTASMQDTVKRTR
jgi:hypothetical protein